MVAKFATNARGAMLLLNLIQVTESISGSDVPLAMIFNSLLITGLSALHQWDKQSPMQSMQGRK